MVAAPIPLVGRVLGEAVGCLCCRNWAGHPAVGVYREKKRVVEVLLCGLLRTLSVYRVALCVGSLWCACSDRDARQELVRVILSPF